MNKKINSSLKWIACGILLFCFTILVILVSTNKVSVFDEFIYLGISKIINPTMTSIVKIVTNFADPLVIVAFAIIFSYIIGVKKKDRKTAILFCLNLVIVALLNYILKNIFARTRPDLINIINESGYSFPSGHSAISMGMYGYIIYLINTRCENKKAKTIISFLLGTLILLIGLTRVYLGVHYASDVIASFVIYLGYLIIYTHITKKI